MRKGSIAAMAAVILGVVGMAGCLGSQTHQPYDPVATRACLHAKSARFFGDPGIVFALSPPRRIPDVSVWLRVPTEAVPATQVFSYVDSGTDASGLEILFVDSDVIAMRLIRDIQNARAA